MKVFKEMVNILCQTFSFDGVSSTSKIYRTSNFSTPVEDGVNYPSTITPAGENDKALFQAELHPGGVE